MTDGEAHGAGRLVCANPNCARPADKGERIVADQCRGTFQGKRDWIVGVGSHGSEFISDAHNYAGRVRPVSISS